MVAVFRDDGFMELIKKIVKKAALVFQGMERGDRRSDNFIPVILNEVKNPELSLRLNAVKSRKKIPLSPEAGLLSSSGQSGFLTRLRCKTS